MDMKRILQAMDEFSTKPVETLNEGANPHKVTLPVQMAMQHYQTPVIKKESNIRKYFEQVEATALQKQTERQQLIKQYAQKISRRILESNYFNRHDAYEKDRLSSISGMDGSDKREFKRAELQHELGHESNNIAISINGKTWKVIPGRGLADSPEEWKYLQHMKDWAEKKSARSGKKWSVHLTGADPT